MILGKKGIEKQGYVLISEWNGCALYFNQAVFYANIIPDKAANFST